MMFQIPFSGAIKSCIYSYAVSYESLMCHIATRLDLWRLESIKKFLLNITGIYELYLEIMWVYNMYFTILFGFNLYGCSAPEL